MCPDLCCYCGGGGGGGGDSAHIAGSKTADARAASACPLCKSGTSEKADSLPECRAAQEGAVRSAMQAFHGIHSMQSALSSICCVDHDFPPASLWTAHLCSFWSSFCVFCASPVHLSFLCDQFTANGTSTLHILNLFVSQQRQEAQPTTIETRSVEFTLQKTCNICGCSQTRIPSP